MVCCVEQECCTAGNGAVFPDDQPVVVALRIVIEHIVALKVARVPDKVVIGRVVPDGDERVGDDVLQVNGAVPLTAGIDFPVRNHRRTSVQNSWPGRCSFSFGGKVASYCAKPSGSVSQTK